MKDKDRAEAIKRAVDTAEKIGHQVKGWDFQPPEAMPNHLWGLFSVLAEHFAESNAKGEAMHVGKILLKIELRRAQDPAFSAALDDFLQSQKGDEA